MLSHNELVSIPYSISLLTTLHTLTLDNNQITSAGLPQELFRLPNLKDLWLHSNSLTILPDTVAQATNLQVCCLHCCLALLITAFSFQCASGMDSTCQQCMPHILAVHAEQHPARSAWTAASVMKN